MGDDDEPVVYVYVGVVESFTRTVAFPPAWALRRSWISASEPIPCRWMWA